MKTNVGKIFLKLVKRYFPKENPLHKISNKNTLKVSYNCMGNIASVLSAQNGNILYSKKGEFCCNCRSRTVCPFDNKVPAGNYMFKVNNRNLRTRCEICSKITIKTPEQGVVLVSLLLTLNMFHTLF